MLWSSRSNFLLPVRLVEQGYIPTSPPDVCPKRRKSHVWRNELEREDDQFWRLEIAMDVRANAYLIMAIKLKVFLYLHGILFRFRRLGFYSFGDVSENLFRSKHAIGVQTAVAVSSMSSHGRP